MNSKFFALLLAAVIPACVLSAQQPSTTPAQPAQAPAAQQLPAAPADRAPDASGPVLRLGVNEVNLIFTVTDKHGHYIPNLKQSDFALLDRSEERRVGKECRFRW